MKCRDAVEDVDDDVWIDEEDVDDDVCALRVLFGDLSIRMIEYSDRNAGKKL